MRPSPIFYFQIVSSVIHLAPAKIFKSKNCRISCQKDQISRVQLSKDQLSKDQLSSSHTINLHETYLSSLTISLKRRHLFLYWLLVLFLLFKRDDLVSYIIIEFVVRNSKLWFIIKKHNLFCYISSLNSQFWFEWFDIFQSLKKKNTFSF